MKKSVTFRLAIQFLLLFLGCSAFAGNLEDLAGKWSVKKTNDGQAFTQTIDIKKDKFIFNIKGADGKVVLYAKGDVKVENLGPFRLIKFFNIQAGSSSDDLESVDDDRTCVYALSGGALNLATNFDKERDKGPVLDVYTRVDK
jgi:hypothetical protein